MTNFRGGKKYDYRTYVLICPIQNEVVYVGVTVNPKQRFQMHMTERSNQRKYNWVQSLRVKDLRPVMIMVSKSETEKESKEIEHHLIIQFITNGNSLFNSNKSEYQWLQHSIQTK